MVARFKAKQQLPDEPPKRGFQKGNKLARGRTKGQPNKITRLIKDALVGALDNLGNLEPIWETKRFKVNGNWVTENIRIIGWRPTGRDGAQGYLIWLGCNHPNAFAALVGKTIPLQVGLNATLDATVSTKFSDNQIASMTLPERLAAFRELIGLTKAMPTDDPGSSPRMIEGTVNKE